MSHLWLTRKLYASKWCQGSRAILPHQELKASPCIHEDLGNMADLPAADTEEMTERRVQWPRMTKNPDFKELVPFKKSQ